jgi:hypothetical protein
LEERIFNQRHIERSTAVFGTFAWPAEIAVEDYDVSEVTALAQHFKKRFHQQTRMMAMQTLHNEWYEFKLLKKGKKLSELLELALASRKIPFFGQLLSMMSVRFAL